MLFQRMAILWPKGLIDPIISNVCNRQTINDLSEREDCEFGSEYVIQSTEEERLVFRRGVAVKWDPLGIV